MTKSHSYKHRPILHWAVLFLFIFGVGALGTWQLMVHPDTPLDQAWNPTRPLSVDDRLTALTSWKLARALGDDQLCIAALGTGAQATSKPDYVENERCGIAPQVGIRSVANAALSPVNTRCQTALRLAMWTQHSLQPAAKGIFGQSIIQIEHFSSYSCRAMRTISGGAERMSTHATADAIDISGFVLADGTRISLFRDWAGKGAKPTFLKRANETACTWFRVTLGPEYNRLHADHFHLQHTGFGLCR